MTAASRALYRRANRTPVRQFVSDYEVAEVADRVPAAPAQIDPAEPATDVVEQMDAAIEAHRGKKG